MKFRCLPLLLLFVLAPAVYGDEAALQALIAQAPLIKPQPDGVVYLNVEAAALISVVGGHPRLINQQGGVLKVDEGYLDTWNADQELPYWRIELPQGGRYRVVLNHATNLGRESAAQISFLGKKRQSVAAAVPSTGGWDVFAALDMGTVDLDAGDCVVEFKPTSWTNPQWIIKLADIRLIPMDKVEQLAPVVHKLLGKVGVNADPEVSALQHQADLLAQKLKAENATAHNHAFGTYTSYDQFLHFDAVSASFLADQEKGRLLARQIDALQQQKLKTLAQANGTLSPQEQAQLKDYFTAESVVLDGATRAYPKVSFLAQAASGPATASTGSKTLFPTGHLEDLPLQPIDTTLPVVNLNLKPPADLAERQARFAARDTDAGIADLCRAFHAAIHPETPGLEDFSRLYDAGRYREALDAYRAYFFDKLAHPEKYGAHTENILFELVRDRGKGDVLLRPNPVVLNYNLHDCAVAEFDNQVVVGRIGPPGSVCWAPPDMALPPGVTYKYSKPTPPEFWKSDAGVGLLRENNFFRRITYLAGDTDAYFKAGLFNALLFSYATTGNKDHLQRWSDYVDDWTMNAMRDDDNCPFSPKLATELESAEPRNEFTLLRVILDERPEFARDLNSATLVRFLLQLQEDYVPYTFRAKRAEIANWGMMGICQSLNTATFLPEFRASDYMARESWRLWNINAIQHNTLDGENIEAWDTGHAGVATEYCNESVPYARLPAGTTALEKIRFWDAMKIGMRTLLVHISPAGFYWAPKTERVDLLHNDLRNRWMKAKPDGSFTIDKVVDEPGAARRIGTITADGTPSSLGLPAQRSDLDPYAAMTYLRDSWQPDSDYFILEDVGIRSQNLDTCGRGRYEFSAGSRILAEGQSLVVDGRPDDRNYGGIRTGGKTDYCGEAGAHVSPDRFYSSPQFDFAEAIQDSPYAHPRVSSSHDPLGIYRATADGKDDPAPIKDVIDHRRVFHPHDSGVWIVSDRIENKGAAAHDYAQFVGLSAPLPDQGLADRVRLLQAAGHPLVAEDPAQARARTANPGLDNVSAYFVGPGPLAYGNHLIGETKVEPLKSSTLETMAADLAAGKSPVQVGAADDERYCGVGWNGAGSQGLLTVLYSRPASPDIAAPFAHDLSSFEPIHGPGGLVGCHLTTPKGAEVWFESGPEPVNALACGPVSAQADALLVVKQDGKISGLLVGGKTVQAGGRELTPDSPDGEFSLADGTFAEVGSIRHAIDTVQISPEADVFTDQARVSFAIPTQDTRDIEFHYTLDGTDPTLASPLYQAPFPIAATTLVKVRPFRRGLKETPWNDNNTDSGLTVSALFTKEAPLPAVTPPAAASLQPGLDYQYFEGPWPRLFTYAGEDGVLAPKSSGHVTTLLDPAETAALRQTDRAYAVRYSGFLQVPATGVYAFHAPEPLYDTTMDAGYDLRVFIDGKEWYPTPALHSRNVWNVALTKGLHAFRAAYVDYRWKTFRNDYWMEWHPEEMWQGTPVLKISGPELALQPIPAAWFQHP